MGAPSSSRDAPPQGCPPQDRDDVQGGGWPPEDPVHDEECDLRSFPNYAFAFREEHVNELFGDRVTDVTAQRRTVRVEGFATGEAFRDYFKANYGPTIAAYRFNADDPEKVAALDRDLADLGRRFDRGAGSTVLDWEYLLLTARRAG